MPRQLTRCLPDDAGWLQLAQHHVQPVVNQPHAEPLKSIELPRCPTQTDIFIGGGKRNNLCTIAVLQKHSAWVCIALNKHLKSQKSWKTFCHCDFLYVCWSPLTASMPQITHPIAVKVSWAHSCSTEEHTYRCFQHLFTLIILQRRLVTFVKIFSGHTKYQPEGTMGSPLR